MKYSGRKIKSYNTVNKFIIVLSGIASSQNVPCRQLPLRIKFDQEVEFILLIKNLFIESASFFGDARFRSIF